MSVAPASPAEPQTGSDTAEPWVLRRRLLDRLRPVESGGIAFISAPRGWGKSTLLAQAGAAFEASLVLDGPTEKTMRALSCLSWSGPILIAAGASHGAATPPDDTVVTLGVTDLAFRRWEVDEFFVKLHGHVLPPDLIGQIHQATNGWPAGLAAVARILNERGVRNLRAILGNDDRHQEFWRPALHHMVSEKPGRGVGPGLVGDTSIDLSSATTQPAALQSQLARHLTELAAIAAAEDDRAELILLARLGQLVAETSVEPSGALAELAETADEKGLSNVADLIGWLATPWHAIAARRVAQRLIIEPDRAAAVVALLLGTRLVRERSARYSELQDAIFAIGEAKQYFAATGCRLLVSLTQACADDLREVIGNLAGDERPEHSSISAEPRTDRRVDIRCFGPLQLTVGGAPVAVDRMRPKVLNALRFLAVRAGHTIHREEFVEVLWPGAAPLPGLRNLHVVISTLRRTLASAGIEPDQLEIARRGESYILLAPPDQVDLVAFKNDLHAASGIHERAHLTAAMGRYGGDVLADVGPADWIVEERQQYRAAALSACRRLSTLSLDIGDDEGARRWAERGLQLDSYDDPCWHALFAAFEQGDHLGALHRARQRYQAILADLRVGTSRWATP